MSFAVDFELFQDYQNKNLVVKDTSNYGFNAFADKADFSSRTIYLIRATTLVEEVIDFPFTGSENSVQDTIDISMPSDQAISIRLEIVPTVPDQDPEAVYLLESTAAMTGFLDAKRIECLSKLDPSKKNIHKVVEDYSVVSAFRRAALVRSGQGDISASQRLLNFSLNRINCIC